MSAKILENSSFGILRTNPKITGNVKVVVDSSNNTFIESISANQELAKSKYKAIKTSASSGYQFDVARVFGNTPSDIFYDVKKTSSDYSVLDNYGSQYDLDYCYGSYSINSKSYTEEFGIFAPIWLEDNLPDYFVIFKLEGPVTYNNKNASSENEYASIIENTQNFKDLFLSKAKIIKTIDLTNKTNIGRYIRNYKSSQNFPISCINFTTRQDQGTYWNGVNVNKPGGFTSMSENIYKTFFVTDRTILENDYFVTTGFERNRLTSANIINFEFLFDDPDATSFNINRYFGLYVNTEEEGTFRLDGNKFYERSRKDGQTVPKSAETFKANNESSYIIENRDGVKLYVDSLFTTSTYEIPVSSGLTANDFIPNFSDVSSLNSIFYIKDKNGGFHNLNYNKSWLSDEVRLQDTRIDIKDFTGFEEAILTTHGTVEERPSKASTFITVNSNIQHGDRYVVALPAKQIYLIRISTANPGDVISIKDSLNSAILNINISSSDKNIVLNDIKNAIKNSTANLFKRYEVSVKNGILILSEKHLSCVDDNFIISLVSGTLTSISVTKQVSSDLATSTIIADSTYATTPGSAYELTFNPDGTINEVAEAMAAAINNIKDSLFEATHVNNRVVIIAKVAGPRFNDLIVGRDIFMTGSQTELITDTVAFSHPDFYLYKFQGGTNNPNSKSIIDINLFSTFKIPNRYIRTTAEKKFSDTLSKVKSVFYYTDDEIRDKNGKLIGFNNFDKYCVVSIDDNYSIFRDSMGSIYLYELYDIPFGRFSIFPIKTMDFNFLSNEYGDELELNTEKDYYTKNFSLTNNSINSTHEDIEEFYSKTGGFTSLLGVLDSEINAFINNQSGIITSPNIESEYDRLNENTLINTSVQSRTVPYINKWVYRNGKDCREKDYRLNVSEAFGLTNFSPSSEEKNRNTNYFTHEWYYLQKLPSYYGKYNLDYLDKTYSYFPYKIDVTSTGLLDINNDYFTEYFTVDYLSKPDLNILYPAEQPFSVNTDTINTTGFIKAIKKQFRYSLFEGANSQNFATTLFRGVKIIIKERVEDTLSINYDVSSIKTKFDTRYNGYKFSCVLIPHNGIYGGIKRQSVEYEFVENRKNKNITFLIYLKIDDILNRTNYTDTNNISIVTEYSDFIDRTILYALKSKLIDINKSSITSNNYSDIKLSGAINASNNVVGSGTSSDPYLAASAITPNSGSSYISGVIDATGQSTLFTEEILINKQGSYNEIIITPLANITKSYKIGSIIDNNRAGIIDTTGALPSPALYFSLTPISIKNGDYTYKEGGYNFWTGRLNRVSFGYIQNLVNQGDPNIKYTTVLEDGTIKNNLFIIELQTANLTMKSNYLRPYKVENKSNISNDLTTLVGTVLKFAEGSEAKISPIYRHNGYYQPKFNDVINFVDPYTTNVNLSVTSKEYLVKQKMRDKNTQLMLTSDFGIIPNFYLHKVNDVNPSSIIQLSTNSSELPVYPLSGQIAIDYKDFYTFKSNWDANYFEKYFEKGTKEEKAGTRSIIEKRSFFGSKIMKIQDSVTLETFNAERVNTEADLDIIGSDILKPGNPYHMVYYEDFNKFILDIYIDKRLIEEISNLGAYSFFNNYINPAYGYGSQSGIEDDVNNYIQNNILPRYELGDLQLFVLKSGDINLNASFPSINSNLTNSQKFAYGYKVDKNVQFLPLSGINNFNLRLIYNKTSGYQYSIAPSFSVNKK